MMATKQTDLRRADALRNRERILDAAERMLERSPSATLADIAAAAGVARSTLHRRFSNRDALLAALQDRPDESDLEATGGTLPVGRLGRERPVSSMPSTSSTSCHRPCCPSSWWPRRSASLEFRSRCTSATSTARICCTWPGRAVSGTSSRQGWPSGRARRRRARGSTRRTPTSPMHGCTPCGCAGGPTP